MTARTYHRRPDWPERLAEVVRAGLGRPFQWGEWDCARFSFDCVLAMTGTDPAPEIRGAYDSEAGAAAQIARYGADLAGAIDELVGGRIAPAFAGRGDLVMWQGCLGPVVGHTGMFITEARLVHIPRKHWAIAWRVG